MIQFTRNPFIFLLELVVLTTGFSPSKPKLGGTYTSNQRLAKALLETRDLDYSGRTVLDRGFSDLTLFKYSGSATDDDGNSTTEITAGVEIICTTCFVKGTASVHVTANGTFDPEQAAQSALDSAQHVIEELQDYVEDVAGDVVTFDFDDIHPPQIDVDIIDLDAFPSCDMRFRFDGMELYMEFKTVLSSSLTYSIPLFSYPLLGAGAPKFGDFGFFLSLDLILSVENEVEMDNGFHIKLDDGVLVDIALFSKNVSGITVPGGKIEFLPVSISTAGTVLKAVLQLGLHAAVNADLGYIDASAGVEGRVFVNIAELTSTITENPSSDDDDDDDCELNAVHEYQLGLGAGAGATVAIGGEAWGPAPETNIPIFFTTLASECAIRSRAPSPTSAAAHANLLFDDDGEDDDFETTSTEITSTVTAKVCASRGIINCPASDLSVRTQEIVKTMVTSYPSGEDFEWTTSTTEFVATATTIAFGDKVRDLIATSGSPIPFVPKSRNGDGSAPGDGEEEGGGLSTKTKIIIGVSVGVGVPLLIAFLVGIWCCCRRRRRLGKGEPTPNGSGNGPSYVVSNDSMRQQYTPYPAMSDYHQGSGQQDKGKGPSVYATPSPSAHPIWRDHASSTGNRSEPGRIQPSAVAWET